MGFSYHGTRNVVRHTEEKLVNVMCNDDWNIGLRWCAEKDVLLRIKKKQKKESLRNICVFLSLIMISGICAGLHDPVQHLRLLQRREDVLSHPSLSLRSPPLPVLDSSSHTASRHLRGHSPGLLVLGFVAGRATESGQGVHELGLSEVECSGLCSLPNCSFVLRRLYTTPRSCYYLICLGYELFELRSYSSHNLV